MQIIIKVYMYIYVEGGINRIIATIDITQYYLFIYLFRSN